MVLNLGSPFERGRPAESTWIHRLILRHPNTVYFGGIILATIAALLALIALGGREAWEAVLDTAEPDIGGRKPYQIAHLGIGYVPENRDIFPKLTVHQNLMLGMKSARQTGRWSFDDMYDMFPRLKERQHTEAGVLSGGEQQMLTLCRTLMGDPDLILIDEPTEGLAPKIVELVGEYLGKLKDRGVSVLLIEQKLAIDVTPATWPIGSGRDGDLRGRAARLEKLRQLLPPIPAAPPPAAAFPPAPG